MSTIVGTIKEVGGTPGNRAVLFRALSNPVVINQVLIVPETVTVRTDAAGEFSVVLVYGDYEMSITTPRGTVKLTISVPDDDDEYSFDQLITSDIIPAGSPAGGAQPNGSPTVFGLVKIDEVGNGVASTGFLIKDTLAAMRAIAYAANNKIAFIRDADAEGLGRIYLFKKTDNTTPEELPNVITPTDGLGRWIQIL